MDGATPNPAQPSAHYYKASRNLQLHSPKIRQRHLQPNQICISIIFRKAIMPCFPQYNYAHKNFQAKLCPELDGVRAATAPHPPRTHRLTPLAFATPCTQIYSENTGIGAFPYFQTCTLSHACHVPCFQTGTLSHACHVTELFKCELSLSYYCLSCYWLSYYCELPLTKLLLTELLLNELLLTKLLLTELLLTKLLLTELLLTKLLLTELLL